MIIELSSRLLNKKLLKQSRKHFQELLKKVYVNISVNYNET
jgi:hypothetical protein